MAHEVGSVTVSLNRAHLSARLKRGNDRAGKALAEQILGDCKAYTPRDKGALQASAAPDKVDGYWCATWNTPYAAYQWYGCWEDGSHVIQNHDLSHNKKATTQWAEAARAEYGAKWGIVAQKEHVQGGKDNV